MATAQAYYLRRTSDFTLPLANSLKGIISFWVKPNIPTLYDDTLPGSAGANLIAFGSSSAIIGIEDYATGTGTGDYATLLVNYSGDLLTVTPSLQLLLETSYIYIPPFINTQVLNIYSNTALTVGAWSNVIYAWDISLSQFQLYINDADAFAGLPGAAPPATDNIAFEIGGSGFGTADFSVAETS